MYFWHSADLAANSRHVALHSFSSHLRHKVVEGDLIMYNTRASIKPLLTDFYENKKNRKSTNATVPLFSSPTVVLNAAERSTMCSRERIKACMKPGKL